MALHDYIGCGCDPVAMLSPGDVLAYCPSDRLLHRCAVERGPHSQSVLLIIGQPECHSHGNMVSDRYHSACEAASRPRYAAGTLRVPAPVPERTKGTACKAVKPRVQIPPGAHLHPPVESAVGFSRSRYAQIARRAVAHTRQPLGHHPCGRHGSRYPSAHRRGDHEPHGQVFGGELSGLVGRRQRFPSALSRGALRRLAAVPSPCARNLRDAGGIRPSPPQLP